MCVKVTCVGKSSSGTVTHIGGEADDGSMRWGLTRDQAIQRIESNEWSFFVARPAADPAAVLVRTIGGTKFLSTAADDTQTNNLDELPGCEPPLEGTDPQFPLSIPGPRQPGLLELVGRGAQGGPVVISPDASGLFRIPGWTSQRPLRRLQLKCNIPFPGGLEVYVERDPTRPDYSEANHKLAQVDAGSPAQVRALEDQGKGWYDWTLKLPDPSYPHRFTPAVVPVSIPAALGAASGLTLLIRNVSYNRYCAGPSVSLPVSVYRTAYKPPDFVPRLYPGHPTGVTEPTRAYTAGAFVNWNPSVKNIGQAFTRGDKRLEVKSPADVGLAGWPQFGDYTSRATGKVLCQPIGFAALAGFGTGGGGIGFSGSGELGIALAILQPMVPGYAGDILFRFVKLGAPSAQPMDLEANLTTPNATVTPRILLDQGEQVALVVDANRFGGYMTNPGRARLLDLGHGLRQLSEIPFNGMTLSASVAKRPDNTFEAVITTDTGIARVPLPKT
jgi:hypothetical protein